MMTAKKLATEKEAAMKRAAYRYEVAERIRAILDQAKREWPLGAKDFEDDDIEGEIIDLVREE